MQVQISEMKALRSFCYHTHGNLLINNNNYNNNSISANSISRQITQFSRLFFSSEARQESTSFSTGTSTTDTTTHETPNNNDTSRGWSIYNIATEKPTTAWAGPITVRSKKNGSGKVSWVCEGCGHVELKWWGVCNSCGKHGTMKEFTGTVVEGRGGTAGGKVSGLDVSQNAVVGWLPQRAGDLRPVRLTDVSCGIREMDWRIPL